ncbi:plasmid mobilization relaxosome protein MobC [Providencia huaxiensis]|uniref:plasmid mobilization relaxosome protein MobC n=1 Tax=Providencia huaxiensis TaxID=2027290 RepID=UPI0034E3B400
MSYKDKYQRKHSITLCFNDEEIKQVEELSKDLKKPKATAIRELILEKQSKLKKSIIRNDNSDLDYQLHKIGVNINQISRAINTDLDNFISHQFSNEFMLIFETIISDLETIKSKI